MTMRVFLRLALLVCLGGFLCVAATLADEKPPIPKELLWHQGTWQAVSYRIDGKETSKEIVESITRTVDGKHVVWKRNGKSFAGTTVELDPTQKPQAIDVIPDGGPFKGEKVLGIYRFEKDRLTLCMAPRGQPRPTSWDDSQGKGISLMTFQKIEPPAKNP